MPRGANRFDYDSIYDILFTVRYTALEERDYRTKVLTDMGQDEDGFVKTGAVRYFSLRNDYADQWYQLLNPVLGLKQKQEYWDPATQAVAEGKPQLPYTIALDSIVSDFVPNEDLRKIKKITLAIQVSDGQEDQTWTAPVSISVLKVRPDTSNACGDVTFASPKSIMRGCGLPSTSTTRMFDGFRSR